jgi:hypothetical protein
MSSRSNGVMDEEFHLAHDGVGGLFGGVLDVSYPGADGLTLGLLDSQ